MNVNVIMD